MSSTSAATKLLNNPLSAHEDLSENVHIHNLSHKSILNHLNTRCTNSLQNLKQTHALVLKTALFQDHYIAGSLVKCYSNPRLDSLSASFQVLEQVSEPNVFVWNSIIKGCLDNRQNFKAISLYCQMMISGSRPNKYTYPPLFKACTIEQAIAEGLQFHSHVVKNGLYEDGHIISAGIQMYASFGRLEEARDMFNSFGKSDVVCCNAMIDGYMKAQDVEAAKELFENMKDKSISSWNTMISGSSNNEMIVEAKKYFDEMPVKDEVSWSAILDGYNKGGYYKEALEAFNQMQREGIIKPKKFILSSALAACANVGALDQGKWIHAYIKRNRIVLDEILGTSLIDMYAKCGRLDLAWDVFERMVYKAIFTWNAMIAGLAMHGRGEDAIEFFLKMQRCDNNMKPNDVTFVALLNACAHAGLVDKGLKYFVAMKEKHGVEPTVEHYGCVVNLLGRAGFLAEAEELILSMPMKPNGAVWGALLGACRIHGNVELGEKIGEILLDLEPENSGRYTLLSNIYAKAGKWNNVEKLRKLMKERGVKSMLGKSVIDLNGVVHEFKVGDSSHPQSKDIHRMVERIIEKIKEEGYMPDRSQALFDISDEEKETSLMYHSEKLAIAFGLLNSEPGRSIRIVKNLRMCEDCHSASKVISRVYERDIIVRDRVRYHHFRNGECSCKDFW
ncbi:hypothetical protein BUALT_Bualt19G0072000 [Buddleja alternifolia]|uniref:DYW domain-containing protein n=1 Tax=Buddleja alternifolia TaxID=168488 RepID=A0AAV6W1V8_9LAMI|nr:hypothetical protein BUALT_Bualt19G0072000 [Buddleja alternifolia]